MKLDLTFATVGPDGKAWKENFERTWPSYKKWFLSEGFAARPGYTTCYSKLSRYMPEIVPVYERLCKWAGDGDLASRFLTMYLPPPYMAGCTQMVWSRDMPMLVRNYDYAPKWFEGMVFKTNWLRPVIGISDCTWGLLDGMNADGLAASLTFGGSRGTGTGFGIPLLLRYVLETCTNVQEAVKAFARVPIHMTYNVTLLDATGAFKTLYLAPRRKPKVLDHPICANHQLKVEWPEYEELTATRERQAHLERTLRNVDLSREEVVQQFLRPPLHQSAYNRSFGTLYTSVWEPTTGSFRLLWPKMDVVGSFTNFVPQKIEVKLGDKVGQ